MIRLHCEFDTQAEAELWRDGMYMAYSPLGYSTHITIEEKRTLVCSGCGSQLTIEEIRGRHPGALTCCPERKMIPTTVWVAYGSRAESCD